MNQSSHLQAYLLSLERCKLETTFENALYAVLGPEDVKQADIASFFLLMINIYVIDL